MDSELPVDDAGTVFLSSVCSKQLLLLSSAISSAEFYCCSPTSSLVWRELLTISYIV